MNTAVQVAPFLWVGGIPSFGLDVGRTYDRLILTASEHQYNPNLFPNILVLYVPLRDTTPTPLEEHSAVQAGRAVASWMRREKNVLITCRRGLNRSCLIAAVALMTSGQPWLEAVETVRAARGPKALGNPHFQRLLRRLEDATSFQLAGGI